MSLFVVTPDRQRIHFAAEMPPEERSPNWITYCGERVAAVIHKQIGLVCDECLAHEIEIERMTRPAKVRS